MSRRCDHWTVTTWEVGYADHDGTMLPFDLTLYRTPIAVALVGCIAAAMHHVTRPVDLGPLAMCIEEWVERHRTRELELFLEDDQVHDVREWLEARP